METLELTISAFTRRTRSLLVRHTQTPLTRGLEPGERVEVRDGATRWTATVRDIDFELTDTLYRLELGTSSTVPQPLAGVPLSTGDVVDLLRGLTTPVAAVPTRTGEGRDRVLRAT
ncbi:hypothetical protein [Nocardioides sp.]|uniref:hypothetical protein n=1 Tax=Nocardioides sp. TaxID=35761 RepID=UPI002613FE92|nr:hypothetical protein [Nocardioides sp.]